MAAGTGAVTSSSLQSPSFSLESDIVDESDDSEVSEVSASPVGATFETPFVSTSFALEASFLTTVSISESSSLSTFLSLLGSQESSTFPFLDFVLASYGFTNYSAISLLLALGVGDDSVIALSLTEDNNLTWASLSPLVATVD